MSEPQTQAGRALLDTLLADHWEYDGCVARIAAIEAEAVTRWLASENAERRLAAALHTAWNGCLMLETHRIPWAQLPGDGSEVNVHDPGWERFRHVDNAAAILAALRADE